MSNTLKEGDRVQYIPKDDYGIGITGILNSIDTVTGRSSILKMILKTLGLKRMI